MARTASPEYVIRELEEAVLNALGLDNRFIMKMVLTFEQGSVPVIEVTEYAIRDDGDPVELDGLITTLRRFRLQPIDEDPTAAMWIRACYLAGHSTADVAEADNVSQRAVQWRISRGRERMALILGWRNACVE